MKRLLILLVCLISSISFNAQNTIKQNELQSTVTNRLSANATQAKRFEIAQLMFNSHHWQNGSIIEVELYNVRYNSGYEKYIIELGYSQGANSGSPKITHVKSEGIQHHARLLLSDPVDSTISYGGYINKTISILLDIRHYSQYVAKITHLRTKVNTFTAHQQIIINENPTGVDIADFTPVSFLTTENVRSSASASYPSQTSRGDAFQVYKNVNNSLEFGLAGASNTRRSWILSRHSDLSGTYGKYYNTLHLQPDTGNKSQYRGIAIGYTASTHIPIGTHLAVNGSVGIGTSNTQGYELAVAGNIVSEKVKVALQANWPDYVFNKEYSLPSLKEVEKQIKENGHLSNIPSAKEVEEKGFFLGEMDSKLLEKIEELTLYTIAQEKEISTLKTKSKEIDVLKEQNVLLLEKLNAALERISKLETN